MTNELDQVFSRFKGKSEELIPILQGLQEEFGYLSEEAMVETSRFIRVPESKVYAVATFYAQFRFKLRGRIHVMVCRGTACHVRGAPKILEAIEQELGIKEGETSEDLEYSIESVACIGACGLSPCIVVNDKVEAKLTPEKIKEIFSRGA